ncbi:hypothetical protein V7S57_16795 [Caulobacter sp. CCNWLY153]|uniref:hypothetical protein n=1 Tax=unclassified Caulobacter TaxID=2648921 RepID=UPI002FEF600D
MTEDEFKELVNSPTFKRLLEVRADVLEGRADAETVEAWQGLQESMTSAMAAVEKALEDYPEDEHEELVREWSRAALDNVDWSFLDAYRLH